MREVRDLPSQHHFLGAPLRQVLPAAEFALERRKALVEGQETATCKQRLHLSARFDCLVLSRLRQGEDCVNCRVANAELAQPQCAVRLFRRQAGKSFRDVLRGNHGNDLTRGDPLPFVYLDVTHRNRELHRNHGGLGQDLARDAQIEKASQEQIAKPERQRQNRREVDDADHRLPSRAGIAVQ